MRGSVRIILFILSLLLALFSIITIAFPFNFFEFLSIDSITSFLESMKGNYILTLIGFVILLFSIRALLLSIKTNGNSKENTSYVIKMMDLGEVKISSDTIVGLVHHVSNRFSGLKNVKVKIDIVEGQLYINIFGEVIPEVNIPEMTKDLQEKVKEHVESSTGVNVSEIRVFITNVTLPNRNLK